MLVSAGTAIRFNPALNFNGSPPDLIVHLVDSSGAAITNGATVNLTGATGGTTRYSSATVALSESVTAVNDAPVNTVGGTLTVAEDSGATNVTGMSISDVDANPATDVFTVTLDVLHGTLNLSGGVPSGVVAANITGNGTATVTVTGTINQINTTLAAAGGLTYTPTGNYNGSDRVQITTDDGGATGLDPGATGTATSESDTDSKTISVTAVNDPVTGTAPAHGDRRRGFDQRRHRRPVDQRHRHGAEPRRRLRGHADLDQRHDDADHARRPHLHRRATARPTRR